MRDLKQEYLTLLNTLSIKGLSDLVSHLEDTDFFIAPASSRFHENYEGGLVEHSLIVYDKLSQLVGDRFPARSVILVSLLHDLCKIGYYKVDYRNAKNNRGQWEKVPYYTVDDKFPYGHGEKSVYLASQFITLTDEEAMAIRWHMWAYSGQQDWNTLCSAYDMFPLAMYLHFADMMATHDKEGCIGV